MVAIKDIAKAAGYSQSTVSRLLSDDTSLSISTEAKDKILQVANEMGYWKNNPNVRISAKIALLILINPTEHLHDRYYEQLVDLIGEALDESDFHVSTFHTLTDLLADRSTYQGFIAVGYEKSTDAQLEKLHQKIPAGVFIDVNPAPQSFDSVQPNLRLAIDDAYQRLRERGYYRIAFVGAIGSKGQPDPRQLEYELLVNRDHLEKLSYVGENFTIQTGHQLGQAVLQEEKLPIAFIVASDTLSVGLLQAFNEARVNVPADTVLISINDSDIASYLSPPLTTYRIDQATVVRLTIQTLQDAINHPHRSHIHQFVDLELVFRKSFPKQVN